MSDTASRLRDLVGRRRPEVAWGVFAVTNVAAMFLLPEWETVPFHFVWVSLTLLYGFRVWRPRSTMLVLALLWPVTSLAIVHSSGSMPDNLIELTEVPLMTAMFAAMVWHARRRVVAITQASDLAEDRRRLLEREREFVQDASHELRTPITIARGHAELLRGACLDAQEADDIAVVIDELERLSVISERLLSLAAAADPGFVSPTPIPLESLVREAGRRWLPAARREWRIEVRDRGTVPADHVRLAAVLDALVENAVAFTRDGDAIGIVGRADGDTAVVEVVDTGCGIAPEQLARIFDRFARADPGRARSAGGTGLGLAVVKAVTEAHGGTVEASSEPGAGSTFGIRLPGFVASEDPIVVDTDPRVLHVAS